MYIQKKQKTLWPGWGTLNRSKMHLNCCAVANRHITIIWRHLSIGSTEASNLTSRRLHPATVFECARNRSEWETWRWSWNFEASRDRAVVRPRASLRSGPAENKKNPEWMRLLLQMVSFFIIITNEKCCTKEYASKKPATMNDEWMKANMTPTSKQ